LISGKTDVGSRKTSFAYIRLPRGVVRISIKTAFFQILLENAHNIPAATKTVRYITINDNGRETSVVVLREQDDNTETGNMLKR
jgi:hypothetical protein